MLRQNRAYILTILCLDHELSLLHVKICDQSRNFFASEQVEFRMSNDVFIICVLRIRWLLLVFDGVVNIEI